MTLVLLVVALVIVQRVSELLLARRNYDWAMARGGYETGGEHYWLFVVLHTAWLAAIILESLVGEPSPPALWPLLLVLVGVAQILRYWAISTLGRRWNTRIIVFADMQLAVDGPYRYLRHPNYCAVALEIAAIPALVGAWYTSAGFTLVNAALLLLVRIPKENEALRKVAGPK